MLSFHVHFHPLLQADCMDADGDAMMLIRRLWRQLVLTCAVFAQKPTDAKLLGKALRVVRSACATRSGDGKVGKCAADSETEPSKTEPSKLSKKMFNLTNVQQIHCVAPRRPSISAWYVPSLRIPLTNRPWGSQFLLVWG